MVMVMTYCIQTACIKILKLFIKEHIHMESTLPQEYVSFQREFVTKGVRAYLERQILTFKIQGQQSSKYPYEEWIVAVQKEYQILLKEKARTNIEERKDFPKSQLEYLQSLARVVEDERLIKRIEYSNQQTISLKKEDAIRYGFLKPDPGPGPLPIPIIDEMEKGPIFLDDSIMAYKYVYDSEMPDCYEKSLKKVRCLLRFYIMNVIPDTPLMAESWQAIRDMGLTGNEEEMPNKIKEVIIELQNNTPKKIDQTQVAAITKAAEIIKKFNGNLQEDRAEQASDATFYDTHHFQRAFVALNAAFTQVAKFNFQQFFFLLKASETAIPNFDKFKKLLLVVGKTGVGKSTFIQYMYGIPMQQYGEHIQGDMDEIKRHPQLRKIVSAKSFDSVTRYCQTIHIIHKEEDIGILDTPGTGDTKCAEVDMSNQVSIVRVIEACKLPIFPILLFSSKDAGARSQNFRNDIFNYSGIIEDLEDNIKGFSYYISHYKEAAKTKDPNNDQIKALMSDTKKSFEKNETIDESELEIVKYMVIDMLRKANNSKFIAIDPLNAEQRSEVLDNIISTNGVNSDKAFISINADRESIQKLKEQIDWHKQDVIQYIINGNIAMALYKLKELKQVEEEFSKQTSGSKFEDYKKIIEKTFASFTLSMTKLIEKCLNDLKKGLSRFNVLEDESIKSFGDLLQTLKHIDMVKDAGYSQYLANFSASNFVETVQKEFNDASKGLKNVNIGDIQWLIFLEKVLKLNLSFPKEFGSLKNSTIQQYRDCAIQLIDDYEEIMSDENLLKNVRKTQAEDVKAADPLLYGSGAGNGLMRRATITQSRQKRRNDFIFDQTADNKAGVNPIKRTIMGEMLKKVLLKKAGVREPPAQVFEKCLENLSLAKKNLIEKQMSTEVPEIRAFFNTFESDVQKLIDRINSLINEDIPDKIQEHVKVLIFIDGQLNQQQGFKSDEEVSNVQASFDFLEIFKGIAKKYQVPAITETIENLYQELIQITMDLYNSHAGEINKQLVRTTSENEIFEASYFKWRFQQIVYLRQIQQVNVKTTTSFNTMQSDIQKQVSTQQFKIRRILLKLQKAGASFHDGVDEDLAFEELDHAAQVIRYFGSLLEPDNETLKYIKEQLKVELQKIIKNFDSQVNFKSMNHPSKYNNIDSVGHVLEEYRHIMRIVTALEIDISTEGGLASKITSEVTEALKVIQVALEQPIFFMTSRDYNEFAKFNTYLKIVLRDSEVFLQTKELKNLAEKLLEGLKGIVMKQQFQLQQIFSYRFYRYLFKKDKEEKYKFIYRPAPLNFKIEEVKDPADLAVQQTGEEIFDSSIWEIQEDADWKVNLKVSTQEIYKLVQVISFLLSKQCNGLVYSETNILADLIRPLLEKEDIWELFSEVRKELLLTYFDGLNIQDLWLGQLKDKEESVFTYREQALQQLKIIDSSLSLQDIRTQLKLEEGTYESSIFNRSPQDNDEGLRRVEMDPVRYKSIEQALQAFHDQSKVDPNVHINELKKLYNTKQYEELVKKLEEQKIEIYENAIRTHIQDDVNKILEAVQDKLSDYRKDSGGPDNDESDSLQELIKVVSQDILKVNILNEKLGAYMTPAIVEKKNQDPDQQISITSILAEISGHFKQVFNQIEKGEIASGLLNVYSVLKIIKLLETCAKDTSSFNGIIIQKNWLKDLSRELVEEANSLNKKLISRYLDQLRIFEDASSGDVLKVFSETGEHQPQQYVDSVSSLPSHIKTQEIEKETNAHNELMLRKYNEIVNTIDPEKADTGAALDAIVNTIGTVRKSIHSQGGFVRGRIAKKLDDLSKIVERRREDITIKIGKEVLIDAFLKKTPEEIVQILDRADIKPLIKDDILTKVQENFENKLGDIIKNAMERFGNDKIEPNLKDLIEDNIPFIYRFFKNASLKPYILPSCNSKFYTQISKPLQSIVNYSIFFIQKQIQTPCQALDPYDTEIIKARSGCVIQVSSIDKAIQTLEGISSKYQETLKIMQEIYVPKDSNGNQIVDLESYEDKLKSFFAIGTQWIQNAVTYWQAAIEKKNSQAIISMVDDLAQNHKTFNNPKFLKAFQTAEVNILNSEFVKAVNKSLNAPENKKALIEWGEGIQATIQAQNFMEKNGKTNKYERTKFYTNIDSLYQELSQVGTKTEIFEYFSLGNRYISDIKNETTKIVISKVDELCKNLKDFIDGNFRLQETLNVLGQSNADRVSANFQKLNEAYNNMEVMRDSLNLLTPKKKSDVNSYLTNFRDALFHEKADEGDEKPDGRLIWMQKQARVLYSGFDARKNIPNKITDDELREISKILIEAQLLKKNLLKFKDEIQIKQDDILDEYDRVQSQRKNKGRLDVLRRKIQGQDEGASIIAECKVFEGDNMKELAKKLATKGVDDVLKQMTGDDIVLENEVISQRDNLKEENDKAKKLLKNKFDLFNQKYQSLIKELTIVKYDRDGKTVLPIDLSQLVSEIRTFKLSKRKWLDTDIDNLPQLLSKIFALWSLQKPDHLRKQQEDRKDGADTGIEERKGDDDILSYLNQPHPAQVLGIMRILGVGYNPDEYKNFSEEEKEKKSPMFGNSLGALKSRIRNNLVQIKTGEGKSVTLAVLSIIFALCDFDVRCACYSIYLSQRDYKAFEAMFTQLGLQDHIKYSTFNQICEEEINKNGELRDIILNLILKNPEKKITVKRDPNPRPKVLLIDEVDVFFSDDFFGKVYNPQALIKCQEIIALTDYFWNNRDQNLSFFNIQKTEEYKQAKAIFQTEYSFLIDESVKRMVEDIKDIENYELGKLMNGKIKYKVGDSWSETATDGYKTLFAYYYFYYRDYKAPGKDSISLETLVSKKAIGVNFTQFSFAEGPLISSLILGLTGTLDTLSTEQQRIMKSVYNLSSKTYAPSAYDIPPELKKEEDKIEGLEEETLIMNEVQLEAYNKLADDVRSKKVWKNELSIKILPDEENWFRFITEQIEENLKTKNTDPNKQENKRAVVVLFANDVILKRFNDEYFNKKYQGSKFDILTEKDEPNEKTAKVTNATNQGQVTFATREFGRGTDFKYQGELVIHAGGLHVIQTFYTNDYSEEIQVRGRTRRQGTTGSYELIVLKSELESLMSEEFIQKLLVDQTTPEGRYMALHRKRQETFEEAQKNKLKTRTDQMPNHYSYAKNIENVKKILENQQVDKKQKDEIIDMLKTLNKFDDGKVPDRVVKALVLIDATGSMGDLLVNAKNSVTTYFQTVKKTLAENGYQTSIFKLQMAFYRNYKSGMKILEYSPWTGPEEIENLENFLKGISAFDGQNCEAVEIGLWHANREIYEPEDGIPVSLIYVIGDAPANPNIHIVQLKKKYGSTIKNSIDLVTQQVNDDQAEKMFIPHSNWGKTEFQYFGPDTTCNEQLQRIECFEDNGIKIPIYSYYLISKQFKDNLKQVKDFFSKIRINNERDESQPVDPEEGLLDVKDKMKLAELFCKYTMFMIAKKNTGKGNAEGLIKAAKGLSFT